MRWSIVRLIWLRDLRDQLRDRRTLFMVLVLPLLLYPVLGFVVLKFALGFADKPSVIGIVRDIGEDFPAHAYGPAGVSVVPDLGWLSATSPGLLPGAAALVAAGHETLDYPALIHAGQFTIVPPPTPLEHAQLLWHAQVDHPVAGQDRS